jgi:tetratricopeptide (TPR) repeat protein
MDHGLSDRPPASTRIALVVVVALCAFAMALKPVRSPDVWHHVKSGWFVVENRGPATVDVFSCTAQGKPWIQYEWLAQLSIYGIYRAGGATGLVLFQAAAAALLALLLMAAIRVQSRAGLPAGAGGSAALATALALCAVSPRFFSRPETFTWILFAGWLIAVEKIRSGRGAYFALPAILMILWVNLHGAWPAGLAWLGLICAGETALRLFGAASRLPKPAVLRLWAALGLAAAATLVNPYGFHIWEVPLKLTNSAEMSAVIAEWQRPDWAHWLDIRHVGAWVFLLAILAAPRRVRLTDALVVLAFGALALSARRHMALAMIAVAPIAAGQFSALWEKWEKWEVWEAWEVWVRRKKSALSSSFPFLPFFSFLQPAAVALACVALAVAALGGPNLNRAGLGVDHRMFPEGAARFLSMHQLDGNLFNTYDYGNYLLFARYPQNRVFIDGRVDVYGAEGLRLYTAVRHAEAGWQKILDEHSIEICVLATEKSSEFRLLSALHRSPDWALVYWDDLSAIYVKRAPDRQAFLSRAHVYAVRPDDFDPAVLESPERLARAEQDYRANLQEDPNCALAAYSLGRCLIERDRQEEATALIEKALALGLHQHVPDAHLALSALYLHAGQTNAALIHCLKARELSPGDWKIRWNLSMIYEKKGDLESALVSAQEALQLQPDLPHGADRVRALQQKIVERGRQP